MRKIEVLKKEIVKDIKNYLEYGFKNNDKQDYIRFTSYRNWSKQKINYFEKNLCKNELHLKGFGDLLKNLIA